MLKFNLCQNIYLKLEGRMKKNGQVKINGKWYDRGTKVCPTCKNILPYGRQCGICR